MMLHGYGLCGDTFLSHSIIQPFNFVTSVLASDADAVIGSYALILVLAQVLVTVMIVVVVVIVTFSWDQCLMLIACSVACHVHQFA